MDKLIDLVNKRTKIEKWASNFLDKNSELMDDVDASHPVFKEYNAQMAIYQKICDDIRALSYARNK